MISNKCFNCGTRLSNRKSRYDFYYFCAGCGKTFETTSQTSYNKRFTNKLLTKSYNLRPDTLLDLHLKIYRFVENLKRLCSKETCYPKVSNNWTMSNPLWGHCAVVSLILNDKYGGRIFKCKIKEYEITHYFNIINDDVIDVTLCQYPKPITKVDIEEVSRDEILENENTTQRYQILKNKINF